MQYVCEFMVDIEHSLNEASIENQKKEAEKQRMID